MNWQAIGAVGEVLGALGVIATLGYLAVQIRQNTRSVRASSYHAVVTNLSNLAAAMGRDAPVTDLFVRGQSDLQALNPTEQRQFALLVTSVFRSFEDIFYQFNQNMFDDVVWVGWKHRITRYFWQPGVQAWWPTWRDDCHPDFKEFLESSNRPSAPGIPLFAGGATDPAAFYEGESVKPSSSDEAIGD